MTVKDCPHGKLTFAESLAGKVKALTIPAVFDWFQPFHLAIAELRHTATNYQELLDDLSLYCVSCMERAGVSYCPLSPDDLFKLETDSYLYVKMASTDLAHQIYRQNKP